MKDENRKVLILDQYLDENMSVTYYIIEAYHFEEGYSSYFVLDDPNMWCWADDIREATKFPSKAEAEKEIIKYYNKHYKEMEIGGETYTTEKIIEITDANRVAKGDFTFVIRSVLEVYKEKMKTTVYIKNSTKETASFYEILVKKKEDK